MLGTSCEHDISDDNKIKFQHGSRRCYNANHWQLLTVYFYVPHFKLNLFWCQFLIIKTSTVMALWQNSLCNKSASSRSLTFNTLLDIWVKVAYNSFKGNSLQVEVQVMIAVAELRCDRVTQIQWKHRFVVSLAVSIINSVCVCVCLCLLIDCSSVDIY